MVFSPLTASTVPHSNKFSSRGGAGVQRIIVHHWAGTQGGDARLINPTQEVSANYILYSDGTLVGQVPEEYRAWTSGSPAADNPSITIEIQNSSNAPEWRVSDAAIGKLIQLIADLATRYNWSGTIDRTRVRGHQEFASTACPGPYLYPQLASIASAANTLRGGGGSTPESDEQKDEDEPMKAMFYMTGNQYNVLVWHPVSGLAHEYSTTSGAYNNAVAANFGTGSFLKVDKSHYDRLKADLANVRAGK